MTSSSPSSVLKCLAALALAAVVAGCEKDDGSADFAAGRAAFESRDLKRAVKSLAAGLERNPGNVDALVLQAQALVALGELPDAAAAIDRAVELAGSDRDVVEVAAQVAFYRKDYARTAALFRQLADSAEPEVRSRGLTGLAIVDIMQLGTSGSDMEEVRARARTRLLAAIRLDGRNAAARYHLGKLYRDAFGYNESAIDQFDLFVRLAKGVDDKVKRVQRTTIPDLKETIAREAAQRPGADKRDVAASAAALKKAEAAWAKQTFKTAKLRYNDAYVADVLSYPAALGLAKAWEKTDTSKPGQLEALNYYKVACALRPSAKDVHLHTGELALKLGQAAVAVETFSRAVAASPNDVTAIDALIRALQKAGRGKTAAVYQQYRATIPVRKR